jgi:transcriptional regulator with XRE-family HTH domain
MKLSQKVKNDIPDYAILLRQSRKQKGWTLEDVAKKLGVSLMAMSHYELGRREPKLWKFEKWLSLFDLELTVDFKNKKK